MAQWVMVLGRASSLPVYSSPPNFSTPLARSVNSTLPSPPVTTITKPEGLSTRLIPPAVAPTLDLVKGSSMGTSDTAAFFPPPLLARLTAVATARLSEFSFSVDAGPDLESRRFPSTGAGM